MSLNPGVLPGALAGLAGCSGRRGGCAGIFFCGCCPHAYAHSCAHVYKHARTRACVHVPIGPRQTPARSLFHAFRPMRARARSLSPKNSWLAFSPPRSRLVCGCDTGSPLTFVLRAASSYPVTRRHVCALIGRPAHARQNGAPNCQTQAEPLRRPSSGWTNAWSRFARPEGRANQLAELRLDF